MTKTCYFCAWEEQCGINKPFYNPITEEICKTRHAVNIFKPTDDWLEYMKLLDDQIAFREKTVNDLYERDCKIKELKKDLECMKLTVGTLSERPY